MKAARCVLQDLGEIILETSALDAIMTKVKRAEYESTIESLMSDDNMTLHKLQSRLKNCYEANKEERKKYKRDEMALVVDSTNDTSDVSRDASQQHVIGNGGQPFQDGGVFNQANQEMGGQGGQGGHFGVPGRNVGGQHQGGVPNNSYVVHNVGLTELIWRQKCK